MDHQSIRNAFSRNFCTHYHGTACPCKPWLTSLLLPKQLPQYFSFYPATPRFLQQCLKALCLQRRYASYMRPTLLLDLEWTIISQYLRTAKPEPYATLRPLMHHPHFSATVFSAILYTLARIIANPPQRHCHLTCTPASCLGIAYFNV
ncbi:hypothetical protein BCR37DRAFT_382546, partial [Protomyces lactucae-debilis]